MPLLGVLPTDFRIALQFRSLRNFSMLKIAMRKSSVATKTPRASTRSKRGTRVGEQKQLYLVQKSRKGVASSGNGFRHHRPKESRVDAPAPRVLDPANAQIDYADNERGAINKLLAL